MARMPTFEEIRADFEAGVRTAEQLIEHPFRHQTTAAQATAAPIPTEDRMSLTTLEEDVKRDLTDGMAYLEGLVGRVKAAAPGIIATSEAVAGSTVGQLAELFLGKFLPPDIEAEFLAIAKRYITSFGQAAAPAEPQQPQQPVQA